MSLWQYQQSFHNNNHKKANNHSFYKYKQNHEWQTDRTAVRVTVMKQKNFANFFED